MNRLLLLALVLLPQAAAAQQPLACPYDACALRIVDGGGYFGTQVVVRGREGYSVAYARRSPTLEGLFATVDSSATHYERFRTYERYADWSGWAGAGLILTGFIADLIGEGGLSSRSFLFYGGGFALTYAVALPFQRRATSNLAGAIWWYNRSLLPPP